MGDARTDKLDVAVGAAGELIGALMDQGPVNPQQARLIVEAVVRAVVPNAKTWELRDSASRIAAELEGAAGENNSGNM